MMKIKPPKESWLGILMSGASVRTVRDRNEREKEKTNKTKEKNKKKTAAMSVSPQGNMSQGIKEISFLK